MNSKLQRSFFLQDIHQAAKGLLGCILSRKTDSGILSGKIVEVEVYTQQDDPSSHSYKGRSARNEVMFGPPGFLYVYFTYGMHYCCNIVCGPEGQGDAILIRALAPLEGIELMLVNRYGKITNERLKIKNMTNGPAKLCSALKIGRNENGLDLSGEDLKIIKGKSINEDMIGRSTRIGISQGKDLARRYFIKNNPNVSKAGKGTIYFD